MTRLALPKPSKGAMLRAKYARKLQVGRELAALYRTVYRRDGYRCVACPRPVVVGAVDELKRAHPHHIRPRSLASKAEKHTTANVCTVCPFCHADLGDRTLVITGDADTGLMIRRVA